MRTSVRLVMKNILFHLFPFTGGVMLTCAAVADDRVTNPDTAYLQRLESEMPPDQFESLTRALMQRHALSYAARLDASGAIPEPIQAILFLHFDLIRSNKSIIRCYTH